MPKSHLTSRRLAILGAGCAGRSLAIELLARSEDIEIVLFDRRTSFSDDRNWCGWTLPDSSFEECVSHRWPRCIVRGDGLEVTIDLESAPYRRIPARSFYETTRTLIESTGRCDLRLGSAAENVELGADNVIVVNSSGSESFDHAFDARIHPTSIESMTHRGLVQHFVGYEIEADRDVFDPSVATLMDFNAPQDCGIHFFYVLPFSPRTALVEATFMTPPSSDTPDYGKRIDAYLRDQLGLDRWVVRCAEQGRIPMAPKMPTPPPHPRRWMIGTAAGVVKPSTGYAFDAIQRDSRRVAAAFMAGRERPRLPRSEFATWMDRMMVSFLSARPEIAPQMFPRLMQKCPTRRLVRFLNDRATTLDYLAVMRACPRRALAWHCVRTFGGYA